MNNVKFVTEYGYWNTLKVPRDNILDYRQDVERYARAYFMVNPQVSFFCVSVTDFDNKESVIFEFEAGIEIHCTAY